VTQSQTERAINVTERAAIVGRMDAGTATKADWLAWERELEARLS
jgi:hypothetical protein